ncbi:MAG: 3-isopropylmalate dehydratase small subunit [Synergistaceae bacterium]|nr:3-isopropylmalate dehydratase small subunit [Synergistaceae bacterium]
MTQYEGKVFVFGDDVNTDYIISSRRKRDTLDLGVLKQYIMEDIRPGFFSELDGVTIIAAGENFGCGSAMEVAAQVMFANNIPVILAKSFARSYFRNCVNNGVLPVEMDTGDIAEGDNLQIAMEKDEILVRNLTAGTVMRRPGFEGVVMEILECGGIVPYVRKRHELKLDEADRTAAVDNVRYTYDGVFSRLL